MAEHRFEAGTRVDRAFVALFLVLFLWSLHSRFGVPDPRPDATSFSVLTAGMVLMAASQLFRGARLRYGVVALSAVAMLLSFLLR